MSGPPMGPPGSGGMQQPPSSLRNSQLPPGAHQQPGQPGMPPQGGPNAQQRAGKRTSSSPGQEVRLRLVSWTRANALTNGASNSYSPTNCRRTTGRRTGPSARGGRLLVRRARSRGSPSSQDSSRCIPCSRRAGLPHSRCSHRWGLLRARCAHQWAWEGSGVHRWRASRIPG